MEEPTLSEGRKSAEDDPFFFVEEIVETSTRKLEILHQQWRALDDSNQFEDYEAMTAEISQQLAQLRKNLGLLQDTINVVTRESSIEFSIGEEELTRRRAFVERTQKKIQMISREVTDPAVQSKIQRHKREALMRGAAEAKQADRYAKLNRELELDNQHAIEQHQRQLQLMEDRQDQGLDTLGETARRLGTAGKAIGDTLDHHGVLLNELEGKTENAQNRLGFLNRQVARLTRNKDRCKLFCILFLVIVLVVLVILFITSFTGKKK
eukprot:gnl/Trimastix_PCT/3987.p1 GENE.gnl/Trimastix_PCT/3987~~gnl/Trimastix_PCT/3987.p1  ORF type:complete len:266 (+),score=71.71 gnl/Trimastix_PCT/3987:38-835(+)